MITPTLALTRLDRQSEWPDPINLFVISSLLLESCKIIFFLSFGKFPNQKAVNHASNTWEIVILEWKPRDPNLYLYNQKSLTHLDPSLGTFSAIDLTLSDPLFFLDYNWRVYKDLCSSDLYRIIIENSEPQTIPTPYDRI